MLHYTLNNELRQARTSWAEFTLAEYVQIRTGNNMEALCLIAGLSLEELQGADDFKITLLQAATDLLSTEPEGVKPEWLPFSLGAASIGKLELCKHYLRQFGEQPELAMPFIYAAYAFAGEYDTVLSLSGAGFPADLLERANSMPVTDTIGAIAYILAELERIGSRYAPILDKEPEAEQLMADVGRFEKYGFYATLVSYCNGDLTRAAALVELPADVFYTAMCVDTERAEYMEKLQDIKSKQHA